MINCNAHRSLSSFQLLGSRPVDESELIQVPSGHLSEFLSYLSGRSPIELQLKPSEVSEMSGWVEFYVNFTLEIIIS